jgi:hypothetical protein
VNTQAATVAAEVPAVACCLNVAPTLHREHSFDLETSKMSGYPPPQSAPDAAGHAAAQHAAGHASNQGHAQQLVGKYNSTTQHDIIRSMGTNPVCAACCCHVWRMQWCHSTSASHSR